MISVKRLNWLDELQYALQLDGRGDRIFSIIFQGVNFTDGNPTREQFARLMRKLYLEQKRIRRGPVSKAGLPPILS